MRSRQVAGLTILNFVIAESGLLLMVLLPEPPLACDLCIRKVTDVNGFIGLQGHVVLIVGLMHRPGFEWYVGKSRHLQL
jgi:hypothetical protein